MNEKEAREFREACRVLAEGWQSWTAPFRDILPREGEHGRLDFGTAWECAQVEYVWRQKREAARKGREQWQGLYKVAIANSRKRHQDWEREKGLRLTAEGDRDMYKARWEERGRNLAYVNDVVLKAVVHERDAARSTLDTYEIATMKRNGELAAKVESLREALKEAQARADRIKEANLRLCALREADRTGKDADEVLTGLRTCGVLITRRKGSEIRDVSRCGEGRNIGRLVPYALGWNAYVYQPSGPEEFVGTYRDAEKAADAIDGSYPRWT